MFSILFEVLDYLDIYFLLNFEEDENKEDFECLV